MKITFYGAVREVTGSMHLISTGTDRILLDCGMFQGRRKEAAEKNRLLPFDPQTITNIVLSHAHIDHSGRIPFLTKNNFNGQTFCVRATADACEYLLMDSAHIQESDADYLNYKMVRNFLSSKTMPDSGNKKISNTSKNIKKLLKTQGHKLNTEKINELIGEHRLEGVQSLYTSEDAEAALDSFKGYPYRHPFVIGENATCTFYEAGHILGSAVSLIKVREDNRTLTVCYTGDLGRFDKPIIKNPVLNFEETDREGDLMIMESTYGDRLHAPVKDLKPQLKKVLTETFDRGGTVIIPSFAFGRTQE
ncbi:MAG: MBL fold metallo-hydrolase, partial [Desulfobacteraceae bacterium]|nr:MBL fold metallo-hydrolase [Desulfobacteraceae bacterium]